jgi:hypothetical protein
VEAALAEKSMSDQQTSDEVTKHEAQREAMLKRLEAEQRTSSVDKVSSQTASRAPPKKTKPVTTNAAREERQFCGGGGWGGMSAGEAALLAMKDAEQKATRPLWAAGAHGSVADIPESDAASALQSIAHVSGMDAAKQVAGAVLRYLTNASKHPTEQKYRRIKCHNKFFSAKVGAVAGHEKLMHAVGFELETSADEPGGTFLLLPSIVDVTDNAVLAGALSVLSS